MAEIVILGEAAGASADPEAGSGSEAAEVSGPTNSRAATVVSNYLICDRTGYRVSIDEGLQDEWNGAKVRARSWEPRHPQDFVRGRSEQIKGSERPEQGDRFIDDEYPNEVNTTTDLDG